MNRPLAGIAWVLLTALALGYGIGGYALMDPDEGRNAVIAQEMATGGSWLVPHFNGLPFLDKPFLFFAATAASMRALGSAEWAVRLPSVLSTWATLALTVWFSRRLFGAETAWVAGTAFATSLLTISYAHTLIFDSMLTFFVTLALIAFYFAVEEDREPDQRGGRHFWTLLAWAAIAGGTFTKGPVALLLPLLVAVPFALWRRKLTKVLHPLGLLVFVSLVVPWLVVAERTVPGFLHYALVTETWERVTTDKMNRTGPVWYFLPWLLAGAFPWCVMALAPGWSRVREALGDARRPRLIFLGLWIALPLVFFSLSQSKRPGYVLPLIPAVALLAAWSWSAASARQRGARLAATGWLVGGALLLAVGAKLVPEETVAKVTPLMFSTAAALGLAMLAAGILGWWWARRPRLAPMVLSLPLVLAPILWAPLLLEVSETRSGRAMAAAAAPILTESTVISGVESYSPSLAFYLGRPISISTADGQPLRSNYAVHVYPEVVGAAGSTFQPAEAWREALAACSTPFLFLLKTQREDELEFLRAANVPLLHADRKYTLMGPCQPPGRRTLEEGAMRPAGDSAP